MKVSWQRAFAGVVSVPIVFIAGFTWLTINARPVVELHEVEAQAAVASPRPVPVPEPRVELEEVFNLKATAYNPLSWQTDSTPFTTATGARAEAGVVALSRDLLPSIPYGSMVRVVAVDAPHGCLGTLDMLRELSPGGDAVFRVEDTTHARKRQQVDFLMPELEQARHWGVCAVTLAKVD